MLAGSGSPLLDRAGTVLIGGAGTEVGGAGSGAGGLGGAAGGAGGRWGSLQSESPVGDGGARGADLAVALFTSGSTGEPKVVLHTHRGLAHKALGMVAAHGLRPSDAVLMPAPLAHISGLLNGVLLPVVVGMRAVLMERWDPERANALVPEEGITFMIGPPAYFSSMAAAVNFSTAAIDSVRIISCGSMTIAPEFVEATRVAFGAAVKRTYGSTEAPTITTSAWDDPPDRARDTDGRVVGRPSSGSSTPRPGGRRSRPPRRTRAARPRAVRRLRRPRPDPGGHARRLVPDGRSGHLDGDGWLTIVGRTRDLIIRGGENIVPAEVERVLESHPAVLQAVVVGYPDDLLGERVGACVIVGGPFGLEECRSWCARAGIARFKTPERVSRFDVFPTLSLGKPDRTSLRARLLETPAGP